MLLENNSERVINLINTFENLKDIDKVRLAIHLLEDLKFSYDFNLDQTKKSLDEVLSILDKDYGKVIVNFSKYTNLMLISSWYLELEEIDKKKFTIEMLFNIFQNDFKDNLINNNINENINVYDFYYSLGI